MRVYSDNTVRALSTAASERSHAAMTAFVAELLGPHCLHCDSRQNSPVNRLLVSQDSPRLPLLRTPPTEIQLACGTGLGEQNAPRDTRLQLPGRATHDRARGILPASDPGSSTYPTQRNTSTQVCLMNKSEFFKLFQLEVQAPGSWRPLVSQALVTTRLLPLPLTSFYWLAGQRPRLPRLEQLTPDTRIPKLVPRSPAVVLST